MEYRIDRWTERGVTSETAKTKRVANELAVKWRGDTSTVQTVVTKPNGDVRICRNLLRTKV